MPAIFDRWLGAIRLHGTIGSPTNFAAEETFGVSVLSTMIFNSSLMRWVPTQSAKGLQSSLQKVDGHKWPSTPLVL
ncbi:hypothetical protein N9L26_02140 [Candidatus Pacebacteria bacterium]|nr:hypothetical protein [Candidatus Paceibacterota bacterium]